MRHEAADKQGAVEIQKVAHRGYAHQADGGREGGRLVTALEAAWSAIRAAHEDVPQVVLVVASSGPTRGGFIKWGHYAAQRWAMKAADDTHIPEVFISGEGLQRAADSVFETLLHEAAHGMAAVRKIEDTSRDGRYHNQKFKALAEELGLDVSKQGTRGWATTVLGEQAAKRWEQTIAALGEALRTFRFAEGGRKKGGSRHLLAVCRCGTKIRLTQKSYDSAPIVCGACEEEFQLK